MIKAVLLDLGDTLIFEQVDDRQQLDDMRLQARPGVRDVLEQLSERYALALVTDTETSNEAVVRRALSQLGLEGLFSAVVTSQDLGVSKPSPVMFHEALRRVGASADEAVMVGNDLDRDVLAAEAAGLKAVFVTDSPYFDPSREPHPATPVAKTISEVPALVDALAAEAVEDAEP